MEELHPRKDGGTIWRDRVVIAAIALFAFYYFYGVIGDIASGVRGAASGVDIAISLFYIFMNVLVWVGGGAMVFGFVWGIAAAYLRLADGKLEYRWRWWKWEHVRGIDLKTVTEARIDDHLSTYRGRTNAVRSIMFTAKVISTPNPSSIPVQTSPSSIFNPEEQFFPLPKGVSEEEANLFLQKISQEIKRVNGGW